MRASLFVFIATGLCGLGVATAEAADLAAAAPPVVEVAATNWTVQLNSEVRYFSWSGQLGIPTVDAFGNPAVKGGGNQVYTPTTLSATGTFGDGWKLEALIRSGYVSAHQSTSGVSGTVGTPTDTVPSATLTYLGIDGFQPFASLSLNLPTGKAAVYGVNSNARMDPDLLDVPTFGEGFNVGPTIGANIPLSESAVMTLSAGYTARGNFHQDGVYSPFFPGPQATLTVHPGDLATANISITSQIDPWTISAAATYVHSGKVQSNGTDQLEPGHQVSLSLVVGYAYNENISVRGIGSFAYTFRNRTPAPPFGLTLALEQENSNSAVSSIRLEPTYRLDRFSFGPIASFQYRDTNAYDSTALQFVPAKTRASAGGQASYALTEKASLNARVEHVWTHVRDASLSAGVPGLARDSVIAVVGGTYTF